MTAAPAVRALLADGRVVTIRLVGLGDEAALLNLHARLSERSRYLRFFNLSPGSGAAFVRALLAGLPDGAAVVGERDGRMVGLASYSPPNKAGVAEAAVAVADPEQSHGLGTLLLEHLISTARERGVRAFTAVVLAENAQMMRVFTDLGLPLRVTRDGPELTIEIPLSADERYLAAMAERERRADAASLHPLLRPASVAVVGASRREGSIGRAVLANILGAEGRSGDLGYRQIWPVNPHAGSILGVPAYPSIAALPAAPDLAVLCVPAAAVPEVAEECGRRGVPALAVITAGITGVPELENGLRAAIARYGMRLVGPNCLGIASSAPGTGPDGMLDATFARARPAAGTVGVASQSGGIGIQLFEQFARLGVGVSSFVSLGDKYDVSGNDMLRWWASDPDTEVGVLYLESFGNPRAFSRLARHLSARMPLIAVRVGTSERARQAAASHTGASATPAVTRDALYRQAGVIAVDSLTDVLATVTVLTRGPSPVGSRLAVVSNAGGAGVLVADACAANGLALADLAPTTATRLRELLPDAASVTNPVDTTAGVGTDVFATALRTVLADPGVDGAIAISAPTALGDLAPAIPACAGDKPLLAVRLDQAAAVSVLDGLPSFADPTLAATAYARAAAYRAWRAAPRGTVPELSTVDESTARAIVDAALDDNPDGCWLGPEATGDLLRAFGIPAVPTIAAADADAAVAAARRLDDPSPGSSAAKGSRSLPVAMKAVVPGLTHKSDRGGVLLGLSGPDAVRAGYENLAATFGPALTGVVVQPMVAGGIETLVGVVSDAVFGPLVVFGAGGTTTDVLDDRTYRLTPLTDLDADAMLAAPRCARLLAGYRGAPAADRAALRDVLLRVGALADRLPEVVELDINPLLARPDGCVALDARIRVARRHIPDHTLPRLR